MLKNDHGSALLISLVLVAVITLLGAGLLHLGVVESRAMLGSEIDYRAFEVAQSGIDRALHVLYLDYCGSPGCTNAPLNPSWADGSIGPAASPISLPVSFAYQVVPLGNTGLMTGKLTGADEVTGVGQYEISMRHITPNEAAAGPFFRTCDAPSATSACRDLILVRSRGTYRVGAIETQRTLQVLARAQDLSSVGNGITAGSAAGSIINGNAHIAGSINIVGCPVPPCATLDVSLAGNAAVRNSYAGAGTASDPHIPASAQDRIPRLNRVCPRTNPNCNPATQGVETLGAVVRMASPIAEPAIKLRGDAAIGQPSAQSYSYGGSTVTGKPTMDGMYIANGCQQENCKDNYDYKGTSLSALKVYSDNGVTNPYDINPPPAFPSLTDFPVTIGGVEYQNYACADFGCPGGTDYFGTHAATLTGSLNTALTSSVGLTTSTTADAVTQIAYRNPTSAPGTYDRGGCILWDKDATGEAPHLTFTNGILVSLSPLVVTCTTPAPQTDPLLIYIDGPMRIGSALRYAGSAVIVAKGDPTRPNDPDNGVWIADDLIPSCISCPNHDLFPDQSMLSIATPRNMLAGTASGGGSVGKLIFAFLYAEGLGTTNPSAPVGWSTTRRTNIIGSVVATRFDMGNNTPRFWQVRNPDPTGIIFPVPTKRWMVAREHWWRCRSANPNPGLISCP